MESVSTEKSINSVPLCSMNSSKSDLSDKPEEPIQYKEVMGNEWFNYQQVLSTCSPINFYLILTIFRIYDKILL